MGFLKMANIYSGVGERVRNNGRLHSLGKRPCRKRVASEDALLQLEQFAVLAPNGNWDSGFKFCFGPCVALLTSICWHGLLLSGWIVGFGSLRKLLSQGFGILQV